MDEEVEELKRTLNTVGKEKETVSKELHSVRDALADSKASNAVLEERVKTVEAEKEQAENDLEAVQKKVSELEIQFESLTRERDVALSEAAAAAADAEAASRSSTAGHTASLKPAAQRRPWASPGVRVRLAGAATTLRALRATASSLRALVGEFSQALQQVDSWFGAPLKALLERKSQWEATLSSRARRLQVMYRHVSRLSSAAIAVCTDVANPPIPGCVAGGSPARGSAVSTVEAVSSGPCPPHLSRHSAAANLWHAQPRHPKQSRSAATCHCSASLRPRGLAMPPKPLDCLPTH